MIAIEPCGMLDRLPFNQKLVKLVEKHYLIYLWQFCEDRNVSEITNKCWDQIADEMGTNREFCKRRWKTIRGYYLKYKRGVDNRRTTIYYQSLTENGALNFLDSLVNADVIKEPVSPICPACNENEGANILSNRKNSSATVTTKNNDSNNTVSNIIEKIILEKDGQKLLHFGENSLKPSQDLIKNNIVTYDMIEHLIQSKEKEQSVMIDKDEVVGEKYVTIAAESLINKNSEQVNVDDFGNNVNSNNVSNIDETTVSKQEISEDGEFAEVPNYDEGSTETYFIRMGKYVATRFSHEKQMEIKLKISSFVTNIELEMLQNAMK